MNTNNQSKSMKALTVKSKEIIATCKSNGVSAVSLKPFEKVSAELEDLLSERNIMRTKERLREVRTAKLRVAAKLSSLRGLATFNGPNMVEAFRKAVTFVPTDLRSMSEAESLLRAIEAVDGLRQLESPNSAWTAAVSQFAKEVEALGNLAETSRNSRTDFATKRAEIKAACARWNELRFQLRAELVLKDSREGTNVTAVVFPPMRRRKRVPTEPTNGPVDLVARAAASSVQPAQTPAEPAQPPVNEAPTADVNSALQK